MDMRVSNAMRVYDVYKTDKASTQQRVSRSEEKIDNLALSEKAKDFQLVRNALSGNDESRMQRVNEIKAQMESGTYNVTARDIANKLLG